MERTAILPVYAVLPALIEQIIKCYIVLLTVLFTVDEQHVCSFGLDHADARQLFPDEVTGIIDVA